MHYPKDQFFRLMEEIEFQSGVHLDEAHEDVFHTKLTGDKVQGHQARYCGESALFEVPYESMTSKGEVSTVKVCAVDDLMGRWPRFAGADAPGVDT